MAKKAKKKDITKKQLEKKIAKALDEAIDLAIDDTGTDPKNYGMLEERICWYLDEMKYDLGYEVDIEFDREEFLVMVKEVRKIIIVSGQEDS